MKKNKMYKGFVIAETNEKEHKEGMCKYLIFLKNEWEMGNGYRYEEMETGSIQEAKDFIDSY